MKITHPLITRLGGLAVASAAYHWMRTLDYKVAHYDPRVDTLHPEFCGPVIAIFWHEYIPALFYLRGHTNTSMLLSRHRDAEWLAHAAKHMGFGAVRGSSSKGGGQALRELLFQAGAQNIAITPDGPLGPRRSLAQGPIFLSSKLRMPLVAIGIGYDRPWRLSTWDRFAIPRPYSRCRIIAGPPALIPANLDRHGIEHYRLQIERLLNCLTEEAEHWAESNIPRIGQTPGRREGVRSRVFRQWAVAGEETSPETSPAIARLTA